MCSRLVNDFTHWPHASESRSTLSVSCPKPVTLHRAMSYVTPHSMTPSTGTPEHCGDLRPPFTGLENKDYKHFTEDKQLTEHEDLRDNPLSFHQPIRASTYDSAESIATPHPESDLDDEQLRALLASPLYSQWARSKCRTIASLSLWTRKLDVQFISRSDKYRETCRVVFKQEKVESRNVVQ